MARIARIKSNDSAYHIVVRSIKEIELFKEDEDKNRYLAIMRKYIIKYGFSVYAYCLMDNHAHFIIDSLGADISQIMKCINISYAYYYNRKYERYGPVFQDRFKSTVIDSDRYMITLSAYIHNNPKDIKSYEGNVHLYPFSSLNEYMNKTNKFGILTRSFLTTLIGLKYKENWKSYMKLIKTSNKKEIEAEVEFANEKTQYLSHRQIIVRDYKPTEVMKYVASNLNQNGYDIYMKYRRECTRIRAISCCLMSVFCNMSQKEICAVIGNITQSGVSHLTAKGIEIISEEREIVQNFIAV